MRSTSKVLALAVALLALLPIARSLASPYYVLGNGNVTAPSLGNVSFRVGETTNVLCRVTLRGSFTELAIGGTVGERVGAFTEGSISGCTNGTVEAVLGMPWSLLYEARLGTLPTITGLRFRVEQPAFRVTAGGVTCLYRGAGTALLRMSGSGPVYTSELLTFEASRIPLVEGGRTCQSTATIRSTLSLPRSAVETEKPWIVTMGDSYISGEAGRWAGNSNRYGPEGIDALGSTAYFDNSLGTGEIIVRCHRSRAAEVNIGVETEPDNLACSGASTWSGWEGEYFKPGLDFYESERGNRSQSLILREFAREHRKAVRLIVVSIGGNDFKFGEIVQSCVKAYLNVILPRYYCSELGEVIENFTPSNVTAKRTAIKEAILNVRRAMTEAGYEDADYKILVQNYPSALPPGEGFRYLQTESRQGTGGCGFWNVDANWANEVALPTINETIATAVTQTGLTNVLTLDLSTAFNGHRLCERGVGLLEEKAMRSWRETGAVDETEWINQIRTVTTIGSEYYIQESLHPNYWAQLALRNCLRQAWNGGSPRGGRCTISGTGVTERGEPRMRLE